MADSLAVRAFDALFGRWMGRRIADVRVTGLPRALGRGRPVLLCSSHTSWWDGFLARAVARLLRPDTAFHALALERELEAHPVLRWLGGVGVRPGSTGSVRGSLRQVEALARADRDLVLAVFPQGRIWPADRRPLGFRPGVRLYRRALQPAWAVPVALRLEPLADPRPTAFVSLGRPLGPSWPEDDLVEELEHRVGEELDAIAHFLALHGERAADAWPGPYGRLPRAPATPDWTDARRSDPVAPRPSLN